MLLRTAFEKSYSQQEINLFDNFFYINIYDSFKKYRYYVFIVVKSAKTILFLLCNIIFILTIVKWYYIFMLLYSESRELVNSLALGIVSARHFNRSFYWTGRYITSSDDVIGVVRMVWSRDTVHAVLFLYCFSTLPAAFHNILQVDSQRWRIVIDSVWSRVNKKSTICGSRVLLPGHKLNQFLHKHTNSSICAKYTHVSIYSVCSA